MPASSIAERKNDRLTVISGARYALGPHVAMRGSIQLRAGRCEHLHPEPTRPPAEATKIELDGFLLLPGIINAHDHLQYGLHPRMGHPPYSNYVEWGDDIHATLPGFISRYNSVPKDVRLWWGGIRNLLCGVTTVCHHDPLWPALQSRTYPIKVLSAYGWAHSVGLDPEIRQAWNSTPDKWPFVVHVCEGTDERAKGEISELDKMGGLNAKTVIVHGLALDESGIALLQKRQSSLILCLSSNHFLYDRLPDLKGLTEVRRIAIGNDSPLTAAGDLLDEVRFAIQYASIPADVAYEMITERPASILHLPNGEGHIRKGGRADLVAVRDDGDAPCRRMHSLSWRDVEFVMIDGRVQLASEDVCHLLPAAAKEGMENLRIDGCVRWLRSPVRQLVQEAEAILGRGMVSIGERKVQLPDLVVPASPVVLSRPIRPSEARL